MVELTSATSTTVTAFAAGNSALPDGARMVKGFVVFDVKSKREHYRDTNPDCLVADSNDKDEITGLTFYTHRIDSWKLAFREFYSDGYDVDEREIQGNKYQETVVEKGKGKTSKITIIYCRNTKIILACIIF